MEYSSQQPAWVAFLEMLLNIFLVFVTVSLCRPAKTPTLLRCLYKTVATIYITATYLLNTVILSSVFFIQSAFNAVVCACRQIVFDTIDETHYFDQVTETRIQTIIKRIQNKNKRTIRQIHETEAIIPEWDTACSELQRKIRATERFIGRKIRNWPAQPDRAHYHRSGGVVIWSHPIREEPSGWAVMRLLKGQKDPRVHTAIGDLSYAEATLRSRNTALNHYMDEYDLLEARLEEITWKRNSVKHLSDMGKGPHSYFYEQARALSCREGNVRRIARGGSPRV